MIIIALVGTQKVDNQSLLETLCILSRNYCLICEGMMKAGVFSKIHWMDAEGEIRVPLAAKRNIKEFNKDSWSKLEAAFLS